MYSLKKLLAKITILELLIVMLVPNISYAATLTSAQDILSTNKANTGANHTITFVTPTGVTAGQTITLTMSDFTIPPGVGYDDMDFAEGDSGTCSTAAFTDKTLAGAPSGATWGAARTSSTILTLTSGSDTITAGHCVQIKVGTNATVGGAGTDQIQNPVTTGSKQITIAGTMADSSVVAVAIVTDPQVNLSALVGSSLTMTLDSASVNLGTLTSGSTTTGTTTVTINTNSNGGYYLKYYASNLSNQSGHSITALATKTAASPGTEQWGINAATVGNAASGSDSTGSATSNYNTGGSYMLVPSVENSLGFATGTAQDHAYTVTYGVDISSLTPAGSYTGTVDYIVYGAF